MRIFLIEPYHTGSHAAWAEGYARHSRHQVALVSIKGQFWKWRMQGGAVTLGRLAREKMADLGRPDLILASDMLNLPAFLGLTRDRLAGVPVALYMHENQLTYPLRPGENRDLTYAMINWLSLLAADRVFFNSSYHLETFFDALPRLLKHFPDYTHTRLIPSVEAKSQVLAVGCDLARFDPFQEQIERNEPPLILWNQRWEYDKNPRPFFQALYRLADEGLPFQVALAGRNFRVTPAEFERARSRLADRLVHYGYAKPNQYARLLWRADVVVSTAIHEFFGIAIVEALYCGCWPILPRRLSYPGLLPPPLHPRCLYKDLEGLMDRLRWALTQPQPIKHPDLKLAAARFDWSRMAKRYDTTLADLA